MDTVLIKLLLHSEDLVDAAWCHKMWQLIEAYKFASVNNPPPPSPDPQKLDQGLHFLI